MATSTQLLGDITAAAQAKLTTNIVNPDLVSSRVVTGAELQCKFGERSHTEAQSPVKQRTAGSESKARCGDGDQPVGEWSSHSNGVSFII